VLEEEELVKHTGDANPAVRAAAIQELGLLNDQSLGPVFLKAINDPAWQVRLEGLTSLANLGSPAAIVAIRPLLEDDHPSVRQLARDAINVLRKTQRFEKILTASQPRIARSYANLDWPAWMGRVEIIFATISAIFSLLFTIYFLVVDAWANFTLGDELYLLSFILLIAGIIFLMFVVAGILQARPHFQEILGIIKDKPWRRLIGFIFLIDIAGFFAGGFIGQIIFIVGLSAGVPLAIVFFASEIWDAVHKQEKHLDSPAASE